jgi:hypothetical protein
VEDTLAAALLALVAVAALGWYLTVAARRQPPWRRWCGVAAVGVGLLAVALPWLVGAGRGSITTVTVQLCLAIFASTPLGVLALPGRPGARTPTVDGAERGSVEVSLRALRWLTPLVPFVAVVVLWRAPVVVDALARSPILVAVELPSAAAGALPLWRALVGTPARLAASRRLALAMLAAWSTWIVAYVIGFSGDPYPAFAGLHASLGSAGDQELAAGLTFGISALALVPVVFLNLSRWLGADAARPELTLADFRRRADAGPLLDEPGYRP